MTQAVLVSEIEVEFVPTVPVPGEAFQVILRGTAACLRLDEIRVEGPDVTLMLNCDCFFTIPPSATPFEEVIDLPALATGSYDLVLLDDSVGTAVPISTTPFVVGPAPAIPLSPPALIVLAAIIAATGLGLLRR